MASQNLNDLSMRCDRAQRQLSDFQRDLQQTASGAYQDVTHLLEMALTSLLNVVTVAHAHYSEDGDLDDAGKMTLQKMTKLFDAVETKADECSSNLGKIHEAVESLSSAFIAALNNDIQRQISDTQQRQVEADREQQGLKMQLGRDYEEYAAVQRLLEKFEQLDDPRTEAMLQFVSPFQWLGDRINGGNMAYDQNAQALQEARQKLQELRDRNNMTERRMREALVRSNEAQQEQMQAMHLQQEAQSVQPRAANLTRVADQFKAAIIHIKGRATMLRKEAGEVEASAGVTSLTAYTKADFAAGILNIVEEAIFDFVVKDEAEMIMAEILRQWTVNGENKMPARLKKKYDGVQAKIDQLQQGSGGDEWNRAVADAQRA